MLPGVPIDDVTEVSNCMTPRRISRRPSPTPPLEPAAFVRRLAAEVGADGGKRLVKRAIAIVEATGRPNAWIFEVRRARERGSISPAVARFLIYKFAESAMTALISVHPRLSALTARIERIEREHGLAEDEYWHVDEGPPEWQALNQEWDAVYEQIMIDTFLRNGESELAAAGSFGSDPLFAEGRTQIFGPLDT